MKNKKNIHYIAVFIGLVPAILSLFAPLFSVVSQGDFSLIRIMEDAATKGEYPATLAVVYITLSVATAIIGLFGLVSYESKDKRFKYLSKVYEDKKTLASYIATNVVIIPLIAITFTTYFVFENSELFAADINVAYGLYIIFVLHFAAIIASTTLFYNKK